MAGASGDHSHTLNSAASRVAFDTSREAGYDCQKFRSATARPPLTSPVKTSPEARRPAPAEIQQLSGWCVSEWRSRLR